MTREKGPEPCFGPFAPVVPVYSQSRPPMGGRCPSGTAVQKAGNENEQSFEKTSAAAFDRRPAGPVRLRERPPLTRNEVASLRTEYSYVNWNIDGGLGDLPRDLWVETRSVLLYYEIIGYGSYNTPSAQPDAAGDPDDDGNLKVFYFPVKVLEVVGVNGDFEFDEEHTIIHITNIYTCPKKGFERGDRQIAFLGNTKELSRYGYSGSGRQPVLLRDGGRLRHEYVRRS